MKVPIASQHGDPIRTLDAWEQHASTKGKWQDDFSAKELARLWLTGEGPAMYVAALGQALTDLNLTAATAEAKVAFDPYAGGVRNHDVLAFGYADVGPVVVGVEGKVNEHLDASVNAKYEEADAIRDRGENTNLDRRMNELLDSLAGRRVADDARIGDLRYQLFTAVAGTLAAADHRTKAVAIVVHLIRTPRADRVRFKETKAAVGDFVDLVLGDADFAELGGPYLPSQGTKMYRGDLPIWVGIVETEPSKPDH